MKTHEIFLQNTNGRWSWSLLETVNDGPCSRTIADGFSDHATAAEAAAEAEAEIKEPGRALRLATSPRNPDFGPLADQNRSPPDADLAWAALQGALASQHGLGSDVCPYSSSGLRESWMKGWNDVENIKGEARI